METIRLGLIGDNIAASRAPNLHHAAARLCGIDVSYQLLVPKELGVGFDALFDRARDEGMRGLNITYPYKEIVVRRLEIDDPMVRAIAACNTVVFDSPQPKGANTDYTGFIGAYRESYGAAAPGVVAMAGSGGVGKAIAFALAQLQAKALHLFDVDREKSEALARALGQAFPHLAVRLAASIEEAGEDADGVVNCTPLGMVGHGGSAFPAATLSRKRWAFDAVYTPIDTPFLNAARAAGLAAMTGYELFFHQGIDAFRIFTGQSVDAALLRKALEQSTPGLRKLR